MKLFKKLKQKLLKILSGNNALIVSFIFAGIFIGLMVISQFQSSVVTNSYLLDELKAQKNLLDSFDAERKMLNIQISSLRSQIETARKSAIQNQESSMLETHDLLETSIGLTKTAGGGVEILINDGPGAARDEDQSLVHSADLRDLINLLQTSKVEALSINGQRVLASTPINSVGGTLLINKVQVAPPFTISAIGNLELITARLNDRSAYPDLYDRIKSEKIEFEVQKKNGLVVPAFDGNFNLKYAYSSQFHYAPENNTQ